MLIIECRNTTNYMLSVRIEKHLLSTHLGEKAHENQGFSTIVVGVAK